MSAQHLVLVNLGTPTAPTAGAVRAFLKEFLSDPAVVDYPVWFWKPFLHGFILRTRPARAARQHGSHHRHGATARARGRRPRAGTANRLVERAIAPDDAGYVTALVARWREATASVAHAPQHLVISFHGIPVRFNRRERDTYVHDCQATTRAFLPAIGWPAARATLAYQSRFGPEPWLTPATAEVLETLPRRGVKRVAVITPGFITDGLETLEEIGIRGDESFRSAGG